MEGHIAPLQRHSKTAVLFVSIFINCLCIFYCQSCFRCSVDLVTVIFLKLLFRPTFYRVFTKSFLFLYFSREMHRIYAPILLETAFPLLAFINSSWSIFCTLSFPFREIFSYTDTSVTQFFKVCFDTLSIEEQCSGHKARPPSIP